MRQRRCATVAAIAGLAAASVAAVGGSTSTTITDPCGGGIVPAADVCAVTISSDYDISDEPVPRERLQSISFELLLDEAPESTIPPHIYDLSWYVGDCLWGVRWFREGSSDLPDAFSTRLERDCPDGYEGVELDPPTVTERSLRATIDVEALLGLDDGFRDVRELTRFRATTFTGVGAQHPVYGYSQLSYQHEQTAPVDVPLFGDTSQG